MPLFADSRQNSIATTLSRVIGELFRHSGKTSTIHRPYISLGVTESVGQAVV